MTFFNGLDKRSSYFDDNHAHQQRSLKRPIFMTDQSIDLSWLLLIYFNKHEEYHRIIQEREDKRHIREKYNGRYLTMIDVHMKTFEKRFDKEFHRWIIKTDVEQIISTKSFLNSKW